MLYISRLIITVIYCVLVCIFGCICCLFSPRNLKHVAAFGHMLGCLALLYDLKAEYRMSADAQNYGNAIYICNHQNNYDMVTAANIVQPPTVTVGKKSPLWIPFFGQPYWLTGSLLIDRNNRAKAHSTIAAVVNHFRKRRISIWMFPEGMCSRGCGLLPSKTGAFHAAIVADVPVIPVYAPTTSNKIKFNRLDNGLAIAEMLPPVDISHLGKDQVRELTAHYRTLTEQKIAELNKEVVKRETVGRV